LINAVHGLIMNGFCALDTIDSRAERQAKRVAEEMRLGHLYWLIARAWQRFERQM
jgi:hypothetical protein